MLIFFGESAHRITIELNSKHGNARFPQKYYAIKYFLWKYVMKFEIGRRLFENFRKLEDGVSKFSNIPIFGRNQMNEPLMQITGP